VVVLARHSSRSLAGSSASASLGGGALGLLAAAMLMLPSCGDGSQGDGFGVDLSAVERFDRFPVYYLGGSFRGVPLAEVFSERTEFRTRWWIEYGTYGCPAGEGALGLLERKCPFRVELFNLSVCDSKNRMFSLVGVGGPGETSAFRGARAGRGGRQDDFAVYTRETVVIVRAGRGMTREAARALRPIGSEMPPGRLPAPAPGTLEGELRCQRAWR
jgi:hypothetical protein